VIVERSGSVSCSDFQVCAFRTGFGRFFYFHEREKVEKEGKKKKTILDIQHMKPEGRKIAVLTAYDYSFARLMDSVGIDMILVGDSVGSVISGYENTLPVTMEEMIYHSRAVVRGTREALVVTDMPFLSYQVDLREGRLNAGRLIKEGGAQAVKLEGGQNMAVTIRAIVEMDIPVVGHIGLTPQSIHRMGGYRVQGKKEAQAQQLFADAHAVQEAGAFALVLEGIPASLAGKITESLSIPTIGIGAGVQCDGQVLVIHDILGLCEKYSPKFVKKFADVSGIIRRGIEEYIHEVKAGEFPGEEHSFK
jgi:3-methyl-2-oxobutanoate hydroxymethyltransferase